MKRADALNAIMHAGYHNDTKTGIRIYIENRVSFKAYKEKFKEGAKRKINGQGCSCSECSKTPRRQPRSQLSANPADRRAGSNRNLHRSPWLCLLRHMQKR